VALSLLFNEFVSEVHINDFDKRIYSFWNSILENTDEFIEKIEKTELNIQNWKRQKIIQQNFENYSEMEVGFSTFFLNRTNR
ncbi:DNA adenine methylase, partial [Pseudoalteromonas sp. SIMBA_148]